MLVKCKESTSHLKPAAFSLAQARPPNASMDAMFLPVLFHTVTVTSFQSFTNAKFKGQRRESTEVYHINIPEMTVVELNRDWITGTGA